MAEEPLPAAFGVGFVAARFTKFVPDSLDDVDLDPGFEPITGVGLVQFTCLDGTQYFNANGVTAALKNNSVTCDLDAEGYLSYRGNRGVKLWNGNWQATFGAAIGHNPVKFFLTGEHPITAPFDLLSAINYTPPSGNTIRTIGIASGARSGQTLVIGASGSVAEGVDVAANSIVILEDGQNPPVPPAPGVLYLRVTGVSGTDTQAPTTPTALVVSNVGQTSALFSWAAASDNIGVTGYDVRVGASGTIVPVTGTSYNLSSLTATTTYSLYVRAKDAAGNTSAWAMTSFTTATPQVVDTTPPSMPTGLVSSAITTSGFTISWTASTDNIAVTGYDISVNGAAYSTQTGLTYVASGLQSSTTATVQVRARDAAGNVSSWASISVTTLTPTDTTPPSVPSGLTSSNVTTSGFTVSWTASTDNVGVSGYEVQIGSETIVSQTGLSYTAVSRTAGTNYTLRVRAVDTSGNRSDWAAITVSTTASAGPTTIWTDPYSTVAGSLAAMGETWNVTSGVTGNTTGNGLINFTGSGWVQAITRGNGNIGSVFAMETTITPSIKSQSNFGYILRASTMNDGDQIFFNSLTRLLVEDGGDYPGDGTAIVGAPATWSNTGVSSTLRVEVNGRVVRVYLDGVLVRTKTQPAVGYGSDQASNNMVGYAGQIYLNPRPPLLIRSLT